MRNVPRSIRTMPSRAVSIIRQYLKGRRRCAQVCVFGIEGSAAGAIHLRSKEKITMAGSESAVAARVTHREFKLLLKAERFPTRQALLAFNKLLEEIAAKLHVRYEPFDPIDAQLRIVQFYDTADQTLRKNRLIF